MKLLRYIQGLRKGKEANRLEKEAMQDPFLADAMEGFDSVDGNHIGSIESLQKRISAHAQKKKFNHKSWSIAAGILLIVGAGTYFLLQNAPEKRDLYTVNQELPQRKSVPAQSVPSPRAEEEAELPTPQAMKEEAPPLPEVPQETIICEELSVEESLQADDSLLDEVVVVASRRSLKQELTGSVSGISTSGEEPVTTSADTGKRPANARKADSQILNEVVISDSERKTSANLSSPKPVDGMKAFKKYIKKNLIHPVDEECKDIKGKVVVVFYVTPQGRPYKLSIKKSLCSSADKEAIRLITNGPDWIYGEKEAKVTIKF